jgi:hypothetical protein
MAEEKRVAEGIPSSSKRKVGVKRVCMKAKGLQERLLASRNSGEHQAFFGQ